MKFVTPVATTDATLISSSAAESAYAEWSSATTYAAGDRVSKASTHRVYESAVAGNHGNDPAAANSSYWTEVGPTNRWAMFDPSAGVATTVTGPLAVTVAPGAAIDTLALLDTVASAVRVQITVGGTQTFDQTYPVVDATVLLTGLAAPAGARITVTASGFTTISVGALIVGAAVDLGTLETSPSIGITDYSKRETDDYGVTTVVERTWAKTLTAKSRVSTAQVDALERALAAVRAQPVLWIAQQEYAVVTLFGFFTDLSVDLQLNDVSFCSLTVQGLPGAPTTLADTDAAPTGSTSTLKVIRPEFVADARLVSSNVPENDYAEWSSAATYGVGARVIRAANHAIYESVVGGNQGTDPVAPGQTKWLEVGPTNRWAMFDQALGSATTATGSIIVTLNPATPISALAVLDTNAATVRVQSTGYDRTITLTQTSATFLDLAVAAGGQLTVTISAANGTTPVSVGTLLMGAISPIGLTEVSPKVGLTDYSKKDTDDFGVTSIIERAWAKKMDVSALIATSAADSVLRRLASIRAKPSLWIADDSLESLTIYGFFRDFSINLAENVSTFSLAIEGLSTAPPVTPLATVDDVTWDAIKDPNGTKPANNATVGAPAGTYVGDTKAEDIVQQVRDLQQATATDTTPPAVPTGLNIGSVLLANGTVDLTISWTAVADSDLAQYELQVALNGGGYVSFLTKGTSYVFHGILPNTPVAAKVRAVDTSGNASAFSAVASNTTAKDQNPPAPPTGLSAIGGIKSLYVTGVAPTDPDVEYVEIWWNLSANNSASATLLTTLNVTPGKPFGFSRANISGGPLVRVWAKAIDTSGNASVFDHDSSVDISAQVRDTIQTVDIGPQQITAPLILFNQGFADSFFANTLTVSQAFAAKVIQSTDSLPGSLTIGNTGFTLATVQASAAAGAPAGINRVPFSKFEAGPNAGAWTNAAYNPAGIFTGAASFLYNGKQINKLQFTAAKSYASDNNQQASIESTFNGPQWWVDVTPGERIYCGALIETNNCSVAFYVIGASSDTTSNQQTILDIGDTINPGAFPSTATGNWSPNRFGGFVTVPVGITKVGLRFYAHATAAGSGFMSIAEPLLAGVTAGQTTPPTFNPGPINVDPAQIINANTTLIQPGKILLAGSTPLTSWQAGGDSTQIEGGKLYTNTVRANSLQIGERGLDTIGISFQVSVDRQTFSWNGGGYVLFNDDNNGQAAIQIQAGSVGAGGWIYVYWIKGENVFHATTDWGTVRANINAVIIATWESGSGRYVANYGSTIINGDQITTRSLWADTVLSYGSITTPLLGAGVVTADKIGVTQLSAITANIGLLRTATSGQRVEIADNLIQIFGSNNGLLVRIGVW